MYRRNKISLPFATKKFLAFLIFLTVSSSSFSEPPPFSFFFGNVRYDSDSEKDLNDRIRSEEISGYKISGLSAPQKSGFGDNILWSTEHNNDLSENIQYNAKFICSTLKVWPALKFYSNAICNVVLTYIERNPVPLYILYHSWKGFIRIKIY